jgi:hypothetical protein
MAGPGGGTITEVWNMLFVVVVVFALLIFFAGIRIVRTELKKIDSLAGDGGRVR